MTRVSNSPKQTQKIALDLAKEIVKNKNPQKALILGLEGELGAGKTVFTKGFAKALKIKGPVSSPTFIIFKRYKIPNKEKYLVHIDVYRLKDEKDLLKLGIKEVFESPSNIVLIEWADRVKKILPKGYTKVHIDHLSETKRKITIK